MAVEAPVRKEQILQAAAKLFRERGFHGTAMRDIAEAVGLLGGSLYAHIESKEDLLWELVDSAADRFFDALRPIASADMEIMRKLRGAIVAHVRVITDDLDAAAVYTVEWRQLSPERREAFVKRRDEYERRFRSLVDEAIRSGYLAPSDAASATRFILSALNWVFAWFRHEGPLTPEEVGRTMADYIFDGLRRRTG